MLKQNQRIILASKSPRRQELLKGIGLNFSIETRDVEENYSSSLDVELVPEFLSKLKAEPFENGQYDDVVVITSDTVVVLEGNILEKPKGEQEAVAMLKRLSGKKHHVITGVCLLVRGVKRTFSNKTMVSFDKITTAEAECYVREFKPMDKAGSYGIQEWIGYTKISKIEGCYYNVMGLPLRDLYTKLKELKIVE
jgi:septum formation protein